jgi:hypothetical protein
VNIYIFCDWDTTVRAWGAPAAALLSIGERYTYRREEHVHVSQIVLEVDM